MPRRSAADLASLRVDGRPLRLTPPSSLSAAARAVFTQIVATVEPEHFKPVDIGLIADLATARVFLARANAEIERLGCVVDGQPSLWAAVRDREQKAVVSLSRSLRLTPQSRYDARAAARRADVHLGPRPWEIRRLVNDEDLDNADA